MSIENNSGESAKFKPGDKPSCPLCFSTQLSVDLSVERRPNGDTQCLSCKWYGPYSECFKLAEPVEQSAKEFCDIAKDYYSNDRQAPLESESDHLDKLIAAANELLKNHWKETQFFSLLMEDWVDMDSDQKFRRKPEKPKWEPINLRNYMSGDSVHSEQDAKYIIETLQSALKERFGE